MANEQGRHKLFYLHVEPPESKPVLDRLLEIPGPSLTTSNIVAYSEYMERISQAIAEEGRRRRATSPQF